MKVRVSALRTGAETNMGTRIQKRTTEAENLKWTTFPLLGEVIFGIGVKRLQASKYKRIKEERVKSEMTFQVKIANNNELSDFIQ